MGPIRGLTRPLPVSAGLARQKANTKMNASIHNRFDVEVIDARNGKVRQRAQAENVICDGLWSVFNSGWNNYIVYGSGSGTPATSDTALFKHVAGVSSSTVSTKFESLVFTVQKKITLDETTAVGITITELGISNAASGTTLCTHAMLKDMNGNAISIVKTATDIINIYATVYVHLSNDFKTWIGIGYCNFDVARVLNCFAGLGALNINTCKDVSASTSYNASTRTITITSSRFGATVSNNNGGIAFLGLSNDTSEQYFLLYPVLNNAFGSDITGEAIGTGDGTTVDFSTSFGYVSGTPAIYVNGVAASGATVDSMTPKAGADCYLIDIDSSGNLYSQYSYTSGNEAWPKYYYNPLHDIVKIVSVDNDEGKNSKDTDCCAISVATSDDLVTWVTLTESYRGTFAIPEAYQGYKYFKIGNMGGGSYGPYLKFASDCKGTNIHFTMPPASGAVITADYHTACVAKDANHVYDFSLAIQFGPHTA